MKRFFCISIVLLLTACNSIDVAEVDAGSNPIAGVCIRHNPKVKVADFVSVIQDAFDQRGIRTVVYGAVPPSSCEYQLTYTALRSWDFAPYLAYAEIRLLKNGRQIGSVDYDHNNGLSLTKWEGTEAKIGPLLDKMLADFPVSLKRIDSPSSSEVAASVAKESPAPVSSSAQVGAGPMSRAEWQEEQLSILQKSGVSYEEYQRRYREIMGEGG